METAKTTANRFFATKPSVLLLPGILALIFLGLAVGLAYEGLRPPALNWSVIAVCAGLAVLMFVILPGYHRRLITLDAQALSMPSFLNRPIPWQAVRHIQSSRVDAPPRGPSWQVWIWLDEARSYLRPGRGPVHDDALRLPIYNLAQRDKSLPWGEELLQAMERYAPVERTTADEQAEATFAAKAASVERVATTAKPELKLKTGWLELLMAWVVMGFVGSFAGALVFDAELNGLFGGDVIALPIAGATAALLGVVIIWADMWHRPVQFSAGPRGLFLHERVRRIVPWSEIEAAALYYDSTPVGRNPGGLGWVLKVTLKQPDRWMNRGQQKSLQADGSFSIVVGGFSRPKDGQPTHEKIAHTVEAYMPITVTAG